MPAPADLVYQTTTDTGTGNLTLTAVNGKRSFASAFGTGNTNTFDYYISSKSAAEWEIGVGYIDASTGALVRNSVTLSSSTLSATYSQSGTTITVTATAHGLSNGDPVYLDFTSGTATDNSYIVTVTNANTFTVTSATSATTNGNVTVYTKVTLGAGTKDVTNDIKAADQVRRGSGSFTSGNAVAFDGTSGSLIKDSGIALGTIASQNANNVSITGGSISGLSSALGTSSGGTGLSSYTSGDILYASATNTLSKLAKGTDGNFLKLVSGLPSWSSLATNGINSVEIKKFTSSSLYTPSAGFVAGLIILTGGGGGSGGVYMGSSTAVRCVASGGGGAGGTAISIVTASQIPNGLNITIGVGGAAGTGSTSPTAGGNGQNSLALTNITNVTMLAANGGLGSLAKTWSSNNTASNASNGGAGGIAPSGFILLTGGDGHTGTSVVGTILSNISGYGGASFWGAGGASQITFGNSSVGLYLSGTNAINYGSGAGGAVSAGNVSNVRNGGTGAAGFCCIIEFIST